MKICQFSKRLLSASKLGIWFEYADGHRYINLVEEDTDNLSMYEMLKPYDSLLSEFRSKNYGSIIDCLDYIDSFLIKMGKLTLEERYDDFNDWGLDE